MARLARASGPGKGQPFQDLAGPVFAFADKLETRARAGERTLCEEAAALLDSFENRLQDARVPRSAIKPARYGLGVLIDKRARSLPRLRLSTWTILARQHLFEGREIDLPRVQDFAATAEREGGDLAPLGEFLEGIAEECRAMRRGYQRQRSGWGKYALLSILSFAVLLACYAGFLEYRYQTGVYTGFTDATAEIDRSAPVAAQLNASAEALAQVDQAMDKAPFKGSMRLPMVDAQVRAEAAHRALVASLLPPAIGAAIEERLATEGQGLMVYDALRAWAVLVGDLGWQPAYLAGWLEDNSPELAAHVGTLEGPSIGLAASDPELMELVRGFAAEADEPSRAWLELLRSEGARQLPRWQADQTVPGIGEVLVHRTGAPLSDGVPGLFTQAGWTKARQFELGLAVQAARQAGPVITGTALQPRNDTPDLLEDRLLTETLDAWSNWLSDIRVRPFVDRETAILVSGSLARSPGPLDALLRRVWVETGGGDTSRSHAQQLRTATRFGAMIQYVENGRLAEIARLFSSLNVALGSIDVNAERGSERLMSVQESSRSIQALKAAPRVVVQIAEDVLAQAGQTTGSRQSNPILRQWQQDVFPLCRELVLGRYPFADGPDADARDLAALFGPSGALPLFLSAYAGPYLDTSESPWRWKPEARFAGLTPEGAAFLERAAVTSQALFGAGGYLTTDIRISALAERGETLMTLGGVVAPVRATGEAAQLSWPGPDPDAGVDISIRQGDRASRLTHSGPWGLHRLLDDLRLRARDGGRRVLVDLRTDSGRVFVEMEFDRDVNPVSGRTAMRGLICPPVL